MKQKLKRGIACIVSFCMIFSILEATAWNTVYAAEDGAVDESQEGFQTVRYLTLDAGKQFTDSSESPESHTDRLSDFFAETTSMTWSVDFQTTNTKLQALMVLENADNYLAFYVKDGNKLGFEFKNPAQSGAADNISYTDGNWHNAKLQIIKDEAIILSLDDTEVKRVTDPKCIKDLTWTPEAFTLGGMNHYSSKGGWSFDGKLRNVVCTRPVSTVKRPVWEKVNLPEDSISTGQNLEIGSIQMTYRLKEEKNTKTTLLKVGSAEIYADASSNKIGLKQGGSFVETEASEIDLGITKWHNLTIVKDESQIFAYLDGTVLGSIEDSSTLDTSTIQKGADIHCSNVQLYDSILTEIQVSELHGTTMLSNYPDPTEKLEGYYKGANREIFNAGFDGSVAYRIPAIATSKKTGTVIASIDKRWVTSADTGINDTVVRRSEDNGNTWGPVIPAIDMEDNSAYTIDPEIVVDNDPDSPHYGRIYIVVDMSRRGVSLWDAKVGTGYEEIDGKQYQILYKGDGKDENDEKYTIRENGFVYDDDGNLTEYQVETMAEAPYTNLGNLYKNGVYIGNVYRGNAELSTWNTFYVWMTYSDDDGLTWSLPKDLSPMVKADWMTFFGTGPGAGVQLQDGRLIFTMYCMTEENSNSHFSSYNIYTDDHGETWHRGGSPNDKSDTDNAQNSTRELNESCIVELDNGHLIQFMKNSTQNVAIAVSEDQGATWGEVTHAEGIREVYCEMSVVHYGDLYDPKDKQTKEAIIFANPTGTTGNGRNHGRVRIAFVNDDDTLDWAYDKLIEEHKFLYTSLTVMEDGNIGLIYENEKGDSTAAAFTSFSPQYIMDANRYENTPQPSAIEAEVLDTNGSATERLEAGNQVHIEVTFDDVIFAAGNVTLNLQMGNQVKEAELIGNVNENTLAFEYEIKPEDKGVLKVMAEVNIGDDGVAETIYNVRLTDKPFVTKTLTLGKIGFAELPVTGMSATAGSWHSDGAASNVLDGNPSTLWHTNYNGDDDKASNGGRPKHWITINLGGSYLVDGLKYLPRSGANTNGTITEYQIEISTDGQTFYPYERGEWAKSNAEKTCEFTYGPIVASHVKLRALETKDDFASAAEIRIIGSSQTAGIPNRLNLVQELMKYDAYEKLLPGIYPQLAEAVKAAQEALLSSSVTQAQLDEALTTLQGEANQSLQDIEADLSAAITEAEGKNAVDYSISSWTAYYTAYTAAKNISDNASQAELVEAYLNLKNAENKLKEVGGNHQILVTEITVTAEDGQTEIEVEETLQLTAAVEPQNAANKEVRWSSSDTAKATVSQTGVVTAVGEGEVTITAAAKDGSNVTGDITLTVNPKSTTDTEHPVTGITVTAEDGQTEIEVEETLQLTAAVEPQNAANKEVRWSSSDTAKATVSQTGVVTAVGEGEVTITAAAKDGSKVTGTIKLTIKSKTVPDTSIPVESVTITAAGNKTSLSVKQTLQLTATVKPENATDKAVTWSSSSPKIASVTANGVVTAHSAGKVTITAKPSDGNGGSAGTIVLNVLSENKALKKVTSVTVTAAGNKKALSTGESVKLTAVVKPADAANKTVTWSSSNTKVATVDKNGIVKAVGAGTAVITAKSADGNAKGSIIITVSVKLPGVSETKTINGRNYKITASSETEKTVKLLNVLKKSKNVVIGPSVSIEEYPYLITEINDKAFQKNKKIKNVTIGANVKVIGKSAFANCSKLNKIIIKSNNITKIGKNAFKGIKKNAVIIVPKKKLKSYKRLLKKANTPKTVKIKSK